MVADLLSPTGSVASRGSWLSPVWRRFLGMSPAVAEAPCIPHPFRCEGLQCHCRLIWSLLLPAPVARREGRRCSVRGCQRHLGVPPPFAVGHRGLNKPTTEGGDQAVRGLTPSGLVVPRLPSNPLSWCRLPLLRHPLR
jgi:hypothetical protein